MPENKKGRKYLVEGRVIPERVDFMCPKIPLQVKIGENNLQLTIQIIKSKIFIAVICDNIIEIMDIRNALFDITGAIINFAGFRQVAGISYELDSITETDTDEVFVFGTEGYVFNDATKLKEGLTFRPQAFGAALNMDIINAINPIVSRATFELRNSIRYPDFTAMHCRFAIEAIRNGFAENFEGDWEKTAWEALREKLNIKRETIESFADAAKKQKHGDNIPQTWDQRRDAMQIAWEIVHRYIEFLSRKTPLTDYPAL